jgi:glycerate 2-kinase
MNDTDRGQQKHILRALFHFTIEQIDLASTLDRTWRGLDRDIRQLISKGGDGGGSLYVVSFGKAAVPMTTWLLDNTDREDVRGVLSAPSVPGRKWRGLACFTGAHPVPNQASLDAARAALDLVRGATENDVVVYLISGGGSSLFELPVGDRNSLLDIAALYGTLVRCGADIVEINTVRKHLSAVKGGRLAQAAAPARQITFYVSDVPPGREDSIASGPTMPDSSTLADLSRIVETYELRKSASHSIGSLLRPDSPLPETPKAGDTSFERSTWVSVLDNNDAIRAACRFAENEGWRVVADASVDDVDVATAVDQMLARLESFKTTAPDNQPVCIVSGGELSVPVLGNGIGGRNQTFVLECVPRIAGRRIAVLSAGTDGIDGNSPAAGALADGRTMERAQSFGLDPADFLERSDAYTFFETLGDVITCGPTQNNVRDIRVLVAW